MSAKIIQLRSKKHDPGRINKSSPSYGLAVKELDREARLKKELEDAKAVGNLTEASRLQKALVISSHKIGVLASATQKEGA
ncbi:hypothetical protein Dalk_2806 [Desulfatibacillum aliphaticivorans]|uniref:Uncharacterized protein n=1 Tax=Desulfatibacillum aliphaticivorans TaxID=218208 RepID=B8FKX5_DESAL|nr:hypothetical protein [Desulfatibacillum aliphaticivorans]ACL04497.1 hypothetical protein Dalk_2806 [Desulfatibacillum aliphaticivorans]